MKKIIVMVGKPCCGKSAIGKTIARRLNIPYISSGDIARNMGEDVRKELNNGNFAPEDKMREEIFNAISNVDGDALILDGFPRTKDQLNIINEWCNSLGYTHYYVHIYASFRQVISRSTIRHRDDDNAFGKRIELYYENTHNMIKELMSGSNYVVIDNDFSFDVALDDAYNTISRYLKEN